MKKTKINGLAMIAALLIVILVFIANAGKWIDEFEIECSNGIDDDFDALIDYDDGDCFGNSGGFVTDVQGNRIFEAKIELFKGAAKLASALTNQNGMYDTITKAGNLTIVASHPDFVPKTFSLEVFPGQYTWINFTNEGGNEETNAGPLIAGNLCEDDCTYTGDDLIHKECNNVNGCLFYDSRAMEICDLAHAGWIRDYNSTHEVECAEGSPYIQIEVKATVSCSKENLIKKTRLVNYQGKLIKMHVAVCG